MGQAAVNSPDLAQYVTWLVLLGVFVGLPALLRRAQLRAWQRNQRGNCGQCGKPVSHDTARYMEGFRVCPSCARRLRIRAGLGLGFLGLVATTTCVGWFIGLAADARRGMPDPWWAYLLGPGLALVLGGLTYRAVTRTRAANRRGAERDAAATRRSNAGQEYDL